MHKKDGSGLRKRFKIRVYLWSSLGAVGVLIGNTVKTFCLPLSVQNHDGDKVVCNWEGDESVFHVVQMLRDDFRAVVYIGHCLFVLDRYFKRFIIAYVYRFKIETMFCEFKQQFGGLFYHFWTKAVPKLDR